MPGTEARNSGSERYFEPPQTGQTLPVAALDPPGTLDCGPADVGTQVGCQVTIKSTGLAPLDSSSTDITGADNGDFTADGCLVELEPARAAR